MTSSVQISGSLFVILEHTHVSHGWNAKNNCVFSFIVTRDSTCHVGVSNESKRKYSVKVSFFFANLTYISYSKNMDSSHELSWLVGKEVKKGI